MPDAQRPDPPPPAEPDVVEMWTDGACKGNPGPGGWGAWLRWGDHDRELFGGDALTTNNKMELTAVIEGLRALTRACAVTVHVDSTYVMNGVQRWMPGWKRNGWRTADKRPVKNVELWRALDVEIARHEVRVGMGQGALGGPGQRACGRSGQSRRA